MSDVYAQPVTDRWTHYHRLRKYRRKLGRALRSDDRRSVERLFVLKWRYWHKFFRHDLLWRNPG